MRKLNLVFVRLFMIFALFGISLGEAMSRLRAEIEVFTPNLRLYVDELLLETVLTVPPLLPNETITRKFKWVP